MELVLLTALGVGGATVIGAVVGFAFKNISHKFSDIVLSFAAGVMLAAAVLGLIIPSLEYGGKYGILITVAGIFCGAISLNLIDKLVPHLHKIAGAKPEHHNNAKLSKVLLFVMAIAIHNLPEGIAAGVALVRVIHRKHLLLQVVLHCKIFPKEWSLSPQCLPQVSASQNLYSCNDNRSC